LNKHEAPRKADCVMSKSSRLIVLLLCAGPAGWTQQTVTVGQVGTVVPAGTLLGCILDEPNFSSQTARAGDPVLCKTNSPVDMFGRSLIPRGAYLSARLRNYRDPGHFVGKGWLQLEFTSLTLPGGSIAMDAKVISAARYKVNGEGKIQGKGHATRDAVEWALPILWPIKVLTLPARGPRPNLKGETHIAVRLMEDLLIPDSAYANSNPSSSQLGPESRGPSTAGPRFANFQSENTRMSSAAQPRLTLLALRNGRMYLVSDYRVDHGKLDYTSDGVRYAVPLDALDVPLSRQLNSERGVPFLLGSKN
jgi:hypothetical protein